LHYDVRQFLVLCRRGFKHRHVDADVVEIFKMADFLLNSLKIPTQFMTFKLYLNAKIILNSKFSIIYLFCRTRMRRVQVFSGFFFEKQSFQILTFMENILAIDLILRQKIISHILTFFR
jgi:hypothetical protein